MTAVVLLPGMMCDERLWQHQVRALVADGLHVQVASLSGGDDVGAIARAVLAGAPPRFALAGLSMGGIVAFETWRQAPDRITHLALLDTNPNAEVEARRAARADEIAVVMQGGLHRQVVEAMKPRYLAMRQRGNAPLKDLIVGMALDLGPDTFRRQSLALRDRPDSLPMLATIDVPTLVLCGREDDLCPLSHHLVMAQGIARADLVVLSDCGHLPPLERPDSVTRALRELLSRS